MANLKSLGSRIKSVKSTRKITQAMKVVAAAKMHKARLDMEAARPYVNRLKDLISAIMSSGSTEGEAIPLLAGTNNKISKHLILVFSSDRGLCGSFNGSLFKQLKKIVADEEHIGRQVEILCVGKKVYELFRSYSKKHTIKRFEQLGSRGRFSYSDAEKLSESLLQRFALNEFNACTVIYNRFKSAISQIVEVEQLLPVSCNAFNAQDVAVTYEFEPDPVNVLTELLPSYITARLYNALLDSNASEHAARMSAMDNATRNASDMIKDLTLEYNRTRQAVITKELIEIISGAETVNG